MARFIFSIPKSYVGHRDQIERPIPEEVANAYRRSLIKVGRAAHEGLEVAVEVDPPLGFFERCQSPLTHLRACAGYVAGRKPELFNVAACIWRALSLESRRYIEKPSSKAFQIGLECAGAGLGIQCLLGEEHALIGHQRAQLIVERVEGASILGLR